MNKEYLDKLFDASSIELKEEDYVYYGNIYCKVRSVNGNVIGVEENMTGKRYKVNISELKFERRG